MLACATARLPSLHPICGDGRQASTEALRIALHTRRLILLGTLAPGSRTATSHARTLAALVADSCRRPRDRRPVDVCWSRRRAAVAGRRSIRLRASRNAVGPLSADDPPVVAKGIESGNSKSRIAFAAAPPANMALVSSRVARSVRRLSTRPTIASGPSWRPAMTSTMSKTSCWQCVLPCWYCSSAAYRFARSGAVPIDSVAASVRIAVSRSLKRFARRNLAYRGFIFTLADKHLQHSLAA